MITFWETMSSTLGAKFSNQFGNVGGTGFKNWVEFCKNLTPDQIKMGTERFLQSDDKFIDLKSFYNFCVNKTNDPHRANWRAYKPIEKQPRIEDLSRKTGNDWLKKMREGLA